MRVTQNTHFDLVRDSIFRGREKIEGLQHQAATAKKLNQPSDNPDGVAHLMELRAEQLNDEQYELNAQLAHGFLSHTDQALADLSDIVMRCKEIAMTQSSVPSSTEETRLGLAEEVNQFYQQALGVMNRRLGEKYLFGGFKTQQPPYNAEGIYEGDQGEIMVEIGKNVFIAMNLDGKEILTVKQQPENFFHSLEEFRTALLTGQFELIRSKLDQFDQFFNHFIEMRSKVGSRIQGIQATGQANMKHQVLNASLSSFLEDADMAQVMTDLNKEELVFRSALASAQRLIQPTLMDFLK